MKKLITIYFCYLLVSCNIDEVSNSPDGIYTSKFEHEFA